MLLSALPAELNSFVQQLVAAGQYQSPDDVVCQALRLLKAREERLAQLRADLQAGLDEVDCGDVAPLDMNAVRERLQRRIEEKDWPSQPSAKSGP